MSGLLAPAQFSGDDGSPDPALEQALQACSAGGGGTEAVVAALAGARVLVAVVAVLGESGQSSLTGLRSDKSADMALVTLTAPDGRQALPVFSSTAALAAWDARARPVPVHARRAALSAVQDGCELLVVDPAGAAVLVPRPAVWAVAQDEAWIPSPRHPRVRQALQDAVAHEPAVLAVHQEPGARAELRVLLQVRAGLDRAGLDAVTSRITAALAASQAVADLVDSVELRVVPV